VRREPGNGREEASMASPLKSPQIPNCFSKSVMKCSIRSPLFLCHNIQIPIYMFGKTYRRKENTGRKRDVKEKNLACTRKKEGNVFYSFYSE
jgi:hypothetical protein